MTTLSRLPEDFGQASGLGLSPHGPAIWSSAKIEPNVGLDHQEAVFIKLRTTS
jgi:hypothetical protein